MKDIVVSSRLLYTSESKTVCLIDKINIKLEECYEISGSMIVEQYNTKTSYQITTGVLTKFEPLNRYLQPMVLKKGKTI